MPSETPELDAAMGSLFENYDPIGANNGMFAPAYIRGFQPSEDAVALWQQQRHSFSPDQLEATRMPDLAKKDIGSGPTPYGGGSIPYNLSYTGKGMIDPNALRIASQGGVYDMEARRAAIAARIAENALINQPAAVVPPKKEREREPEDLSSYRQPDLPTYGWY